MSSDLTREGLSDFLNSASDEVDPFGLAACWRATGAVVECELPGDWVPWPGLSDRLRGAWGERLREDEARRRQAGGLRKRASGREVFFETYRTVPRGEELPKPYVVAVEHGAGRLICGLALFGIATAWLAEAVQAFIDALRTGFAIHSSDRRRVPMEPFTFRSWSIDAVAVPAFRHAAILDFRSPLCLRRGNSVVVDPRSILPSLHTRLAGLARWQGCRLGGTVEAIQQYSSTLDYREEWSSPAVWEHHSTRHRGIPPQFVGVLGKITIRGAIGSATPMLAVGELCHVGSRASMGLGRYTLNGDLPDASPFGNREPGGFS